MNFRKELMKPDEDLLRHIREEKAKETFINLMYKSHCSQSGAIPGKADILHNSFVISCSQCSYQAIGRDINNALFYFTTFPEIRGINGD